MFNILEDFKNVPLLKHSLGPTGEILSANQALLDFLGYQHEEYIGHNIREFYINDNQSAEILDCLKRHRELKQYSVEIRCKGGAVKIIEINTTVEKLGNDFRYICDSYDKNALMLLEEQFRKDEREKIEKEHQIKLEEKIQIITHENANTLQAIQGSFEIHQMVSEELTKLVDEQVSDPMLRKKILQKIDEASTRAMDMMLHADYEVQFNKRTLANLVGEQLELFYLNRLVNKIINNHKSKIEEKNLVLNLNLLPRELIVEDNAVKVETIINNILINAIKFTQKGSIGIEIKIGSETEQEVRLAISIKDTGIGISADEQKRLFKQRQQANSNIKNQYGGTGIGLWACRNYALEMNGDITIDSEPGKGSIFNIDIILKKPLLKKLNPKQSKEDIEPVSIMTTERRASFSFMKKTILVVDDNKVIRKTLKSYLKEENENYEKACDGEEAVSKYKDAPMKYSLILMDNYMPKMDGIDAIKCIREFEENEKITPIPICMISGSAIEKTKQKVNKENIRVDDYFEKPIKKETIKAIIKKWVITDKEALEEALNFKELQPSQSSNNLSRNKPQKILNRRSLSLANVSMFALNKIADSATQTNVLKPGQPPIDTKSPEILGLLGITPDKLYL